MSSPPPSSEPLGTAELAARFDYLLGPVLSSRRTAAPLAQQLAPLPRPLQDFVLHWVEVVNRSNYELAYQFAAQAPGALAHMDLKAAEAWILHAMDVYDRDGLYSGSAALKDLAPRIRAAPEHASSVALADVHNVLELFLRGLSGRRLRVEAGTQAYTDTDTLYLPAVCANFPTPEQNFLAYKGLATHLWAQARYGTFNVDAGTALARYPDPARATALFHLLEALRIDAIIERTLPGLARDLHALRGRKPLPHPACARLTRPGATAADSLQVLAELHAELAPDHWFDMGTLRLDLAGAARSRRIEREKDALQQALGELGCTLDTDPANAPDTRKASASGEHRIELDTAESGGTAEAARWTLALDGKPVAPPEHVARLMESILQDLGQIPPEYLVASGDGARQPGAEEERPEDVGQGTWHEQGAHLYNEWDCRRRNYRKNWCVLRELDVQPQDDGFVAATLARYRPQVAQLRRTFEMLRGEDRLLRRQPDGDEVDLDAAVAAYADLRCGMELGDRLMVRRRKNDRSTAVMFMVDMSGSTKGWINDAEREALVLLVEALEVLGDRYAIYGFSGITRKRCEIFRVKRFDEPCDAQVRARISGIRPQDYTRMGVAIRHLATLLDAVEARTKLLITLSDGKPDDYSDNYRGEYGVEDTRMALAEAHRRGIHPFCITIDREARDYLPHMYGAVNWALVDDVARLPLKVAEIYRRLTT